MNIFEKVMMSIQITILAVISLKAGLDPESINIGIIIVFAFMGIILICNLLLSIYYELIKLNKDTK